MAVQVNFNHTYELEMSNKYKRIVSVDLEVLDEVCTKYNMKYFLFRNRVFVEIDKDECVLLGEGSFFVDTSLTKKVKELKRTFKVRKPSN